MYLYLCQGNIACVVAFLMCVFCILPAFPPLSTGGCEYFQVLYRRASCARYGLRWMVVVEGEGIWGAWVVFQWWNALEFIDSPQSGQEDIYKILGLFGKQLFTVNKVVNSCLFLAVLLTVCLRSIPVVFPPLSTGGCVSGRWFQSGPQYGGGGGGRGIWGQCC